MEPDDEDLFLTRQLAPGNIVGVHNYCDFWCDRCGFANRCSITGSLHRESGEKVEDPLLDHLKQQFDRVRTLVARRSTVSLDELLANMGDSDQQDKDAYEEERERRQQRRQHDPILREAEAYSELARAWFETESDRMRAHADALVRRARVENVDDISLTELARILDAIEIVRHDCFLIYVKLRRAIDRFDEGQRTRWDDPVQNDYNGSAKLALICIDRSEGAWRAIHQWYPSCGNAKLLADQLASLRTAVEQRLPLARAFLRPGFDGLVTPD